MLGSDSVGWWAMWITMLGDATALCLDHLRLLLLLDRAAGLPPEGATHATGWLVAVAALGYAGSWALTRLARGWNAQGSVSSARIALVAAPVLTATAMAAMVWSVLPLEPSTHVYPATVCAIVVWITVHGALGIVMQLYCSRAVWRAR